MNKSLRRILGLMSLLFFLVGCSTLTSMPTTIPPTVALPSSPTSTPTIAPMDQDSVDGLSDEQVATLRSLERVDDYPLYTMHYYGAYERNVHTVGPDLLGAFSPPSTWACSLFAALGDAEDMLYGRGFDWEYSPAVLLFTHPPDGYASVSMVNVGYWFEEVEVRALTDLSILERQALLRLPRYPYDGMNEHGLVVGMAAVPESEMPHDPGRHDIGSLLVIREVLDRARDVDQAVAILASYNISWRGGPPLHYLIADPSGRSVLVEFYQGKMIVIPNEGPWHLATNHLRTVAMDTEQSGCWRYDKIQQRLEEAKGQLAAQEAMDLLAGVSVPGTQWSIVYGMSTGDVHVVMGRQYDNVHTFRLDLADR